MEMYFLGGRRENNFSIIALQIKLNLKGPASLFEVQRRLCINLPCLELLHLNTYILIKRKVEMEEFQKSRLIKSIFLAQ